MYTKLADCDVEADAIIDFTSATDFESRMDYAVDKQIPIIECSTGLSEEQMDYLKKASEKVAVLKSANMSLGINLLMKLLKEAAVKLAGDGFEDAIKDHDLILLGNHGCIAVGKTLEDAVKIIEAAEEVLKIYHLTKEIGPVHNISDDDLEELYNNHPGSRRNRYGK